MKWICISDRRAVSTVNRYLDYDVNNQPGTDYVIDHFAKYHHPGAIPLIHNVSSSNAQALDTVLTNLEKEGYEFRSLNEMKIE